MRIAIVGSGISGLAAARELCREHRITVFESGTYAGGHTATVDLEIGGRDWAIDTGFIVYNEKTYPGFCSLLDDLGVETRPTTMGFSVRHDDAGLEYSGHSLGHVFAQPKSWFRPGVWRMVRDIVRLGRDAKAWLADDGRRPMTLREFLAVKGYSAEVAEWYLLPMVGAVWSAAREESLAMPMEFFCRFFDNHGFFDMGERPVWRTIVGGSRAYVRALEPWLENHGVAIRTRCPVRWIRGSTGSHRYREEGREGDVEIVSEIGTERFDAVVIAAHSDTALAMLADPTPQEREVLSVIGYQPNDVVVHTDERLMPKRRKVWSAWNAHVGATTRSPTSPTATVSRPSGASRVSEGRSRRVAVTYNMNILQGLEIPGGTQVMVTLNDPDAIDPKKTLRILRYDHPIFTEESVAAQKRHGEISGVSRRFYAGAYWRYGFHEDGYWSGVRAAEQVKRWAERRG